MTSLNLHTFDAVQARKEWQEYQLLLQTKPELKEREDVLPFFRERHHLSVLIGYYLPSVLKPNCFGHEFSIFGDFKADLIVGDSINRHYLLIEFEDGKSNSIFTRTRRTTSEWSSRLEKAYSQLTDWLWQLDGMRNTPQFETAFKKSDAEFQCVIVIGKNTNLTEDEQKRLRWRENNTVINSKKFQIISFEQLLEDFDFWLKFHHHV